MFQEMIEVRDEECSSDHEMLVEPKKKWLMLCIDHDIVLKEAYLKAYK